MLLVLLMCCDLLGTLLDDVDVLVVVLLLVENG